MFVRVSGSSCAKFLRPASKCSCCKMPCSLATYRARIGNFYVSFAMVNNNTNIFQVSFFCFVFLKLCPILYPLKVLSSFFMSFALSLLGLAFITILFAIAFLFLQHSIFSLCCKRYIPRNRLLSQSIIFFELSFFLILQSTIIKLFLVTFGTIERNPGPNNVNHLKFGMWNIDSLLARDGCKKSLLEGLDSCHKFDIFGLCETYFTDKISDNDIFLNGFSETPFRADCKYTDAEGGRPKGGVCLYFKEHVPIVERKDLVFTDETIIAEIKLKRKKIFFYFIISTS